MWPYNDDEARWLSGEKLKIEDITPEMVDADMRAARRMQAEVTAQMVSALAGLVKIALKSAKRRLTVRIPGHGQTT